MSYELGIDLGTTYTAAAVSRSGDAEIVTLGTHSAAVASVVYVGEDGSMLFGEAAERRAVTDPARVVREFKRRIGDDTPLVVGGQLYPAHELAARMVRWVVDQVAEQQGGPARRIAVTRPASWGSHKKELYREALAAQGLRVTRLAEPQAAAVSYAAAERVEAGSTIAIYDLGGGTFDATVVRKTTGAGFELLGQPEGIEDLGGVDFDEVVFRHVTEGLGSAIDDLDPADPDVLSAVARLRRECVEAKEGLSADTETTIPVLLPGVQTQVRLTRAEFEEMIRPTLERTVEALSRTVVSAGLSPADLSAVLLVGGSSRIPLVTRMVSSELGVPVAVDADPRTAIAMGAALVLSDQPKQAAPDTGPIAPEPSSAQSPYGPAAGGVAAGVTGTVFGAPAPVSNPGDPPQPPRQRQPAASAGDYRTGDYRTGGYGTGDYRTGQYRTGQAPAAGRVEPPPWRKAGASAAKPSPVRIAIGGTVGVVALVGALLIWPGLASGLGGESPPTTVPPSSLPGVQNTDPGGGGDTGGGGGDPGGGNTGGGGGGNTGGGNGGGGGNTGGGGQATTTTTPQTTTTTTLPETTTTAPTTTTTTTTAPTTTTLPETTTSLEVTTPSVSTPVKADTPGSGELGALGGAGEVADDEGGGEGEQAGGGDLGGGAEAGEGLEQ